MKKLIASAIVVLLLLSVLTCSLYAGTYSGGTGEPNNPYQIASKADLLTLAADTNDYDKCFILTADIDLQGQVFTTAIIAANTSSDGGFQGTFFSGMFDGNCHKITNFTINGGSNSYLGLFGYSNGSLVKNLGLENCSVSGDSNSWFAGGLVGHNNGSISNCYSTASVSSYSYVGGLVGANVGEANITNCHSTGTVGGYIEIGGLVGDNSDGDITNCYSTGSVNGSAFIGGFVGDNWGNISSCYSTGAVSGASSDSQNVGGFVGFNGESISNCYSTGSASGFVVGGLVGWNSWSISNSYSTGMVNGSSGSLRAGGLVAVNNESYGGSVVSSFWDIDTSGQSTSAGGTGETTAEMKTKSTFADAGWDFVGETTNGTADTWLMPPDNYPRLSWEDTTLPEFELSVTSTIIWPPNHKMVKIAPSWTVSDDGDSSPEVSLVSVTCNDKNADNDDIRINNDDSIYLRAEKDRIYTITYKACDESENCTTQSATVTVPHDNRR